MIIDNLWEGRIEKRMLPQVVNLNRTPVNEWAICDRYHHEEINQGI